MASTRRRPRGTPSKSKGSKGESSASSPSGSSSSRLTVVLIVLVLAIGVVWIYGFPARKSKQNYADRDESEQPEHDGTLREKRQSPPAAAYGDGQSKREAEPILTKDKVEQPQEDRVADVDRNFKPSVLNKLQISKSLSVYGRLVEPKRVSLKPETGKKTHVRMYTMEHFFTDRECQGLIMAHDKHTSQNGPPIFCFDTVETLRRHLNAHAQLHGLKLGEQDFTDGTYCLNDTMSQRLAQFIRWSTSTSFYPDESPFAAEVSQRIFEASGLTPEHGGKFQITSYENGVGYKTHTDCIMGSSEKRDRYATILIYLNSVEEGGETIFPKLSAKVTPHRGRAVVWNSMSADGTCDGTSIHNASIVTKGRKVILQRWYYHHNFASLGKRPPPPHLPQREANQPLVHCDNYDQGSCRLYDEWFYDHMKDYRAQFKR